MCISKRKINSFEMKCWSSAILIAVVVATDMARAAEYSLESGLKVSARHNDNIKLTADEKTSLQGRVVEPRLRAKVAGEAWDTSLDVDLKFNNFNNERYDSDDQFVIWVVNKKTERHVLSLNTDITRDSTRTSELDTSGIVTNFAVRREQYSVSPAWRYNVNDRNYVTLFGNISRTEYRDDRFSDYDYNSTGVTWTNIVEENIQLTLRLTGTLYEPDERAINYLGEFELGSKAESTSYSGQIEGVYSFAENWFINSLIGSTYTDQTYSVRDPQDACNNSILESLDLIPGICALDDFSSSELMADISFSWSNERSEANVGYSISNQPSSQGYEVEHERYTAFVKYNTSKNSYVYLRINYGTNTAVDTSVSSIDVQNSNRDLGGASVVYDYRFAESWKINAGYRYRWQERETDVDDAESNTILITINYQPTKSTWSR